MKNTEPRTYRVTLRFQYPAWDEKDGITYTQTATSKSQAIRYTRRDAQDDGHLPAHGKGRATLIATEEPES